MAAPSSASAAPKRQTQPLCNAGAPPSLKTAASGAFSVAAWRQEALMFKRRLDALLKADAAGGGGEAAAAAPQGGASGEQHTGDEDQPAAEAAAAEAALDAALQPEAQQQDAQQQQQLDASDLQLPTLHEATLRQLAAEAVAARRQAQLEAGPQAAMIQATRMAQLQAAEWERQGGPPPDADAGEPPKRAGSAQREDMLPPAQQQQQQQQQQEIMPLPQPLQQQLEMFPALPAPSAGQLQAVEGAAALPPLPLLLSTAVPPLPGLAGMDGPAASGAVAMDINAAQPGGAPPLLPGLALPLPLPLPLPPINFMQSQAASSLQLPLLPKANSQLSVEGVAAERQQAQQAQPAPAPGEQREQPEDAQRSQEQQQTQDGQPEQQQQQPEQQEQQQPPPESSAQQQPAEQQQLAEQQPPDQPEQQQQQPAEPTQAEQSPAEQGEQGGGRARRQRKRPRWLEDSMELGAAGKASGQAGLPALPAAQAGGQAGLAALPLPLLPIPLPPVLPFLLPPLPLPPLPGQEAVAGAPPLPAASPVLGQAQRGQQAAQPAVAAADGTQASAAAAQQPEAPAAAKQQAAQVPALQPAVGGAGAWDAAALGLPVVGMLEALPPLPPLPAEWDALFAQLFAQQPGQLPLLPLPWQMEQLLFFPPLEAEAGAASQQQQQQQPRRRGGSAGRGKGHGRGRGKGREGDGGAGKTGLSDRQLSHWRMKMEEFAQLRPERQSLLEAYRQRALAVKAQREREWRQAAGQLASLADSELEPPQAWQLFQDARSRQLQLVAVAAAEAAQLEAGSGEPPADRLGEEEVVLHVALHVPHAPHLVSEEWLVLGSQRLTDLRDCLLCVSDQNAEAMEKEENARRRVVGRPLLSLCKPSAYFYIEGTFYNDMRQPGARDYSEPIRRYNREQGIEAPPHPPTGATRLDVTTTEFSTARMEDTRFDSLWLRLGAGAANLYCHQGGCEHLLSFQDVRLFDEGCDPPLRRHYPFRLCPPQHMVIRDCEVCGARVAKKVTYDDRAAPHSPFFWCDDCYGLMHYDAQGAALYTDFSVFPYTQEYPAGLAHKAAAVARREAASDAPA